jgi:hypothetical protein
MTSDARASGSLRRVFSIFIRPRMGTTEGNRTATGLRQEGRVGDGQLLSLHQELVSGWNTVQFLAFSSIEATKTEF